MGSKSSKQIQRKLPEVITKVKPNTINPRLLQQQQNNLNVNDVRAKDQAIGNDNENQQLLKNLYVIGEVKIPQNKIPFNKSNEMLKILKSRKGIIEEENKSRETGGKLKNRITVYDLRELFELRNLNSNQWTPEKLSEKYDLDVSTVDILLKHLNNYSTYGGVDTTVTWPKTSEFKIS
ncbi:23492_t:CDS:2 [Entrophospora sp. SA101]|nr:6750_t:CDS:2 [Entrophospora sp. SA101]CAJ0764941.1 23492_t:CDS:2 [Entrophospora sp. SA101]CAJ0825928.1 6947_t:CDS:2 [Entrophospora sp. SA101]CAJ0913326.1 8837_t:CDS:2 [Entrophospora sp. SA101]